MQQINGDKESMKVILERITTVPLNVWCNKFCPIAEVLKNKAVKVEKFFRKMRFLLKGDLKSQLASQLLRKCLV